MELQQLVAAIKTRLEAEADPELAVKYSRYFKEGYDAYGLAQGVLNGLARELLDLHKNELGMLGFMELGDLLMHDGKYEEIMLAIILMASFKKQFDKSVYERCGHWLDDGIVNWAHSDVLCGEVMKILWQQEIITLEDIANWRSADSKWKRRSVPVSMLTLLKKEHNISELLDCIEPLMMDEQRVVHQGTGWFLREAWKLHPKELEAFLMKWRETAPRLVYQYATEKMSKEERERFRRSKKKKQ